MPSSRTALAVCVAAMAALAVCLGVGELAGYGVEKLSGDVVSTAAVHPWTGALSTLGLLGWGGCVAMFALTGVTLRGRGDPRAGFFLAAAALLAYLTIDDAYLLHEFAFDDELGIPQPVVYALLAAAILWLARRYARVVGDTDIRTLALAVAALSASVAFDLVEQEVAVAGIEEWLKLSGIACLFIWCFTTAVHVLGEVPAAAPGVAADRRVHSRQLELSS